jgi:hypothetical protein
MLSAMVALLTVALLTVALLTLASLTLALLTDSLVGGLLWARLATLHLVQTLLKLATRYFSDGLVSFCADSGRLETQNHLKR